MNPSPTLLLPAERIPIAHECDLCVIGGSCTGIFAAVRAARLGARVAVVELQSQFGGMATTAQVNAWHSIEDVGRTRQIIGGLLVEVVARLRKRGAIRDITPVHRDQFNFNSAELAVELDALVTEHGIRPFLCARFTAPVMEGGHIVAAVIEDKGGRRAIKAAQFIDASGDGDLLRRAGFEAVRHDALQPVSYQSQAIGIDAWHRKNPGVNLWEEIRPLAEAHGFPGSNPWLGVVPGAPSVHNIFGARLNGVDASDPEELTRALMEGRRIARAFLDMIRERFGESASEVALLSVAQALGVRETWHAVCHHRLTQDELLGGARFHDAIAYGTYPVDIHHPGGTSLLYLDGREEVVSPLGGGAWKRWKPEGEPTAPYFQLPYRCLVPKGSQNLLVAGRLVDADRGAYGALRVQVNTNQMGEAAGVAATLALEGRKGVGEVDPTALRNLLAKGGSIML
ncbi:MAG: FAD-dependent oxidoreductase [Spirochaetes bacterium]|nr:FAD-dependent oxidoreductase [Spirochaetota bacterium]